MLSALPPIDKLLIEFAAFPVVFLVLFALGRWLKRRQRVELGILYVLFCLVFSAWLPLIISKLDVPWRGSALKHLGALSLFLGVFVFLALLRRYFWEGWFERQSQVKAPKFLSQLVGLVVVVLTALVIMGAIYGQSVQGAVFGSTVVVGIIGFAMQDLLGNIIAGIALEIGKPFKPGDWLKVDGGHAEVIEVNWRSTRLRNNDAVYIDIPNKTIAGATIVNLTFPTREHAVRIIVGFDYGAPPNFVKDCLSRAAVSAPGVLAKPAPKVFLKEFADCAIHYEIKFWLDDETRYNDILDAVRTNIWYEAQRSNIRIPFPIRTVQIDRTKATAQPAMEAARSSAKKQPFLQLLDPEQTDKLLSSARLQRFGRGERVIEQGADGGSMFMLMRGEASVLVKANGCETQVASLQDGDYFGEMSLLTGEPRSATVIARTDCEMWEIGKDVLGEIFQHNQALVEKLSDLLAKRRLENEGLLASAHPASVMQEKHRQYRASFVSKLKSFFEL